MSAQEPPPSHRRLDFRGVEYAPHGGEDRIRARLTLALGPEAFERAADGTNSRQGHLQAGGLACVRCIMAATGGRLALTLRQVQAVPAFRAWAVMTLLTAESDEADYRLVGCSAAPGGDLVRGASLAVLSTTNRIVGKYLDPAAGDSAAHPAAD